MTDVIYKIRMNRPCRLFIDEEEMMILEENKLTKITLPEGEYLRKVVAIDNKAIYNEAKIILSGASKLDTITLDTAGLEEAKRNALPKDEFQVGDLMYRVAKDGDGVAVTGLANYELTEVVIPEKIVYGYYIYEVREIGYKAFWWCGNLTSFTIPDSVKKIGEEAFDGCTSLKSITIPNCITEIGWSAFNDCINLTSINIPNSVTSIGEMAFANCINLTSINIPNSVTSIGKLAFYKCSISYITIPNSVTRIAAGAFSSCKNLTSITIPNSVTSIGYGTFQDCSALTSIIVQNDNPIYDSRDNCNAIIETATNALIAGCYKTIIPNNVSSIEEDAFSDCENLRSITIPNSITEIGWSAFANCKNLTSVTIPNNVTKIGEYAFNGCKSLKSVTIPNSVTSIGYYAFKGCIGLMSIIIPSSVTNIGKDAFPPHTKILREE